MKTFQSFLDRELPDWHNHISFVGHEKLLKAVDEYVQQYQPQEAGTAEGKYITCPDCKGGVRRFQGEITGPCYTCKGHCQIPAPDTITPTPVKTIQEGKDEVARKYGYNGWDHFLQTHLGFIGGNWKKNDVVYQSIKDMENEAMQLYAASQPHEIKAKENEAVDLRQAIEKVLPTKEEMEGRLTKRYANFSSIHGKSPEWKWLLKGANASLDEIRNRLNTLTNTK